MIPASQVAKLQNALPFWMSVLLVPLAVFGAWAGGLALLLLPLYAIGLTTLLDAISGLNQENPDPETPEDGLFWYRLVTLIWFPVQIVTVLSLIWYATHSSHLATWEKLLLFYGVGVMSGGIGIVYAHELMHQKNNLERWLGDLLMASVLYSHFRSEHLLVHHIHVGTPRDPVTARYNEGFHRFFWRVLRDCPRSAFRAEKAMLARKGRPWHDSGNPFWRYWALQGAMIAIVLLIGGMGRAWPVPVSGLHRGHAAGADELYRALRADPQTSGRRQIRTCPAAPQLERLSSGVELAADQPATPFRPPLQAKPPFPAAANLFRG